ncbi:MAG: hypothetical protein M5U09_07595 [Gammaproteobacteria bacterium]|nr:hypothetical protein [Gammaproteobacteria bacterium]
MLQPLDQLEDLLPQLVFQHALIGKEPVPKGLGLGDSRISQGLSSDRYAQPEPGHEFVPVARLQRPLRRFEFGPKLRARRQLARAGLGLCGLDEDPVEPHQRVTLQHLVNDLLVFGNLPLVDRKVGFEHG